MQSPIIESHDRLSPVVLVAGTLCLISGVQGIYNVRHYHKIIGQCQLDYGLLQNINVLQYPSQCAQNIVCSGTDFLDVTHQKNHGLCVAEVAKKINLFDAADHDIIWNFEKFKDRFPHTDFQSAYCIAKNYVGSFGYPTLGDLKSALAYQIFKIEKDFNELIRLTDLSWSHIKMPKTLNEFNVLQVQLSTCSNYFGLYGWLGFCGYSCIHNGQTIKDSLLSLAKIHAFLINFQELLKTSIDSDETQLINTQGLLNFSLQHVHHIQKKL